MLRHVVLLQFAPDTPSATVAGIADRLRELPGLIPELRSYTVGADLGLAATGNADLVAIGDFDDVAAYEVYRDHPAHVQVIEEMILPNLDRRSALQFEL